MRLTVIGICEQTHASCQGYSSDDHVSKSCYSVILTPEIEPQILKEIARIEKEAETTLAVRIEEWQTNNPNKDECLCEGEEFVGCTWVEMTPPHESDNPPAHYDTSAETILRLLKEVHPT